MVGRTDRLRIAKDVAAILRDSGAINRFRGQGYTRVDPFEIAAFADLAVMMRPLEGLLGAFVRDEQSGIIVNADRPPGLVHMSCAHELGHYFLGHETTADIHLDYGPNAEPKEREADWFAYHLLMPRQLIVDLLRRKGWRLADLRNPASLYQLSLRLGTSFTATLWTLMSLDMLPVSQAEAQSLAHTPLQRLKHELASWMPQETLSDVWVLDENDRDRILEPRPQDRFVVDLPSHASAGYLWSLEEATEAGFTLRPLTTPAQPARASRDAPFIVGGGARQRYILEHAVEAGSYVPEDSLPLAFREFQPWKSDGDANDSFAMAAEFEAIELGLDERSRERLVAEVAAT